VRDTKGEVMGNKRDGWFMRSSGLLTAIVLACMGCAEEPEGRKKTKPTHRTLPGVTTNYSAFKELRVLDEHENTVNQSVSVQMARQSCLSGTTGS